jgi:hypothetical protein
MVSVPNIFTVEGFNMGLKKLTIQVPEELLERATAASGQGITPTIRRGLELMAASGAYAKLRRLKGKVKFHVRLAELRED